MLPSFLLVMLLQFYQIYFLIASDTRRR